VVAIRGSERIESLGKSEKQIKINKSKIVVLSGIS